MRRLSKLTLGFGVYIIVSASFMLQVRNFLVDIFTDEGVKLTFFALFFLLTIIYILYIKVKNLSTGRILLSAVCFGLVYLFIARQVIFAEKFHVLEYGILGYLASKDRFKNGGDSLKGTIYALCFVFTVGLADEAFQWVLPYRYFDLRDIATNTISGFLGIIQCLFFKSRL